jgi:hypothetical protein
MESEAAGHMLPLSDADDMQERDRKHNRLDMELSVAIAANVAYSLLWGTFYERQTLSGNIYFLLIFFLLFQIWLNVE